MIQRPFETVVTEQGTTVWKICRAMLSHTDAEEAWSETFLAAMNAYPNLDDPTKVGPWLATIARNKAIDQIRRNSRKPLPHESPETIPTEAAKSPNSTEPGLLSDERLATALGELSDQQRQTVILHHIAGFPYGEVAEMLQISVAAARRSAADGIAKLRRIYSDNPRKSQQ